MQGLKLRMHSRPKGSQLIKKKEFIKSLLVILTYYQWSTIFFSRHWEPNYTPW